MNPQVVCRDTTKNDALRKASSILMEEERRRPMVMSIVKNVTVLIYHFSSVSLSSFLILPFKNNRYNKEELMPDKNMNTRITYSMEGDWKATMLSCLVEKPPVAVVLMA